MADVSKIQIESGIYDIKDVTARNSISNINSSHEYDIPTIMIGDSYAVGETSGGTTTGWCDRLKALLNLSNDNYYKVALSGYGFLGSSNFQTGLEEYASNITDPSSIKSIIVCGGYNDARIWTSSEDLSTKIESFISYCHTTYPNAVIYLGMVGNSGDRTDTGINLRSLLNNDVLTGYHIGGSNANTRYLNGVENILKYNNLISADNIHPTDYGYMYLAQWIYKAYTTGYAETFSTFQNMTLTSNLTNPCTINPSSVISAAIHNDVVTILCNTGLSITFDTLQEFNQNAMVLCNFNSNVVLPCKQLDVIVKFYTTDENVTTQGEYLYGGIGILKFNGDYLTIDMQTFRQGEHGFLQGEAVKTINIKPFTVDVSIRNV